MTARIAIVGSGPSGCYLAQALLKSEPGLSVDIIDALPVPYGLVRYGVAADHQGTKAVTRQFARIFERQGARFFGNLVVGRDITLEALRAAYDAVVLAAGLSGDRRLAIPGDDLPGVFGAGRLTRALYEHPDAEPLPDLGPRPLIIGNGNVAVDLLRLLAKTPDELDGSDLGRNPSAWLAGSAIEEITMVGRSPAAKARFDPVMIKELAKLSGVRTSVVSAGESDDPGGRAVLEALAAVDAHGKGPRRIICRFALVPLEIMGRGRVEAVRFVGAQCEETIACSSVVTAIGFEASGLLPRDALVAAAADIESGVLAPGLYAAGWFRRGPRGTIPENRAEAQALAARIVAGLRADAGKPGAMALSGRRDVVNYDGWCRIDAAELAAAPDGRCRAKITSREEMLLMAREPEAAR